MAATRYIAQVSMDRTTGVPEDVVVNTWHFEGDDDGSINQNWATNAPGLSTRIRTFYETIASKLGATLSGDVHIKLYNHDDPKPRVPRYTEDFDIASSLGVPYPAEVALCLSMVAAVEPGVNMARRRGRVFLGPLAAGIGAFDPAFPDVRPKNADVDIILGAAEAMALGSSGGAARLAVYSPTQGAISGQADAAWNDVVTLYIDDAFDTQRRRGMRTSSRRSITVA